MVTMRRICPKCDAQSSNIGLAYRDGKGCPYCGTTEEEASRLWALADLSARNLKPGDRVALERDTTAGMVAVEAPVRIIDWTGGRGGGVLLELEGLRGEFELETPSLPEAVTLWRIMRLEEH